MVCWPLECLGVSRRVVRLRVERSALNYATTAFRTSWRFTQLASPTKARQSCASGKSAAAAAKAAIVMGWKLLRLDEAPQPMFLTKFRRHPEAVIHAPTNELHKLPTLSLHNHEDPQSVGLKLLTQPFRREATFPWS